MIRHLFTVLTLAGLTLGLSQTALAQHQEPAPATADHAAAPAAHGAADSPGADAAHAEGEHGGGDPNILELKPSLALATAIVFGLLLFILWKKAWGPLAKALDEREAHQENLLKQAELAKVESERMLAEHRSLMAQAQDQVRGILDEARRDADSTAQGIIQKAQAEAQSTAERAQRDINQARDEALADIWTRTADLAVSVAGKVLTQDLSSDDRRRLNDLALNQLPRDAAAANGSGRAR